MKRKARSLARVLAAALSWTIGSAAVVRAQDAPAPPALPEAPAAEVPAAEAPAMPPAVFHSPRLGASFEMIPYGGGLAARLTSWPEPTSPLRQAQIQLEPGDTITALDDVPFSGPAMFEAHHSQTKVTFINSRTNLLEARWVFLPPPEPSPWPEPPPTPPPGPYVLGVVGVPVQVRQAGMIRRGLRIAQVTPGSAAAAAGLQPGMTILTAGPYATPDIGSLRAAIAQSGGTLTMTVQDAYQWHTYSYTAYMGGGGGAAYAPARP